MNHLLAEYKFRNESLTKAYIIVFLLLTIGSINFLTMPKFFYRGDAQAIKVSAINLLKNRNMGIAFENRDRIKELLVIQGNAFHENMGKRRYYSRWGFINTLFFAIPEIFVGHNELIINEKSIFAHNCFNVVVGMLIAVYLYLISGLYSKSDISRLIFILSTIYASFYWNYLRAQSYDIFQIIFFLVFYFHFVMKQRNEGFSKGNSYFHLVLAYVSLSILVLVKSFYFFIFFGIFLYHVFSSSYKRRRDIRLEFCFFLAALTASILIFCISNKILYGEYFFSKNASHDPYNPAIIPFSIGYYGPRIKDYFFSLSGSLFFHFPMLIFSFLGINKMLRAYKNEYLFILMLFLISFVVLGGFYSRGEWCYGPRFFLFILPLLSLPVLIFIDDFVRDIKMIRNIVIMIVFCMVQICTVALQTEVNSRHFFLKYYLEGIFSQYNNDKINRYLQDSLFGNIACDFNAFMKNRGFFPPLDELTRNFDDPGKEAFKANIYDQFYKIEVLGSNYYFGL